MSFPVCSADTKLYVTIAGKRLHQSDKAMRKNSPRKLGKAIARAVFAIDKMRHTTVLQKKGQESTGLPLCDQTKYSALICKLPFHLCCRITMIIVVIFTTSCFERRNLYKPPPPPPAKTKPRIVSMVPVKNCCEATEAWLIALSRV